MSVVRRISVITLVPFDLEQPHLSRCHMCWRGVGYFTMVGHRVVAIDLGGGYTF